MRGSPSFALWSLAFPGRRASWMFVMWIANVEARRFWQRLMDDHPTGSLMNLFGTFEGIAGMLRTRVTQVFSQPVRFGAEEDDLLAPRRGWPYWDALVAIFDADAGVLEWEEAVLRRVYFAMLETGLDHVPHYLDDFRAWRLVGGDLFWAFWSPDKRSFALARSGADGGLAKRGVIFNDSVAF